MKLRFLTLSLCLLAVLPSFGQAAESSRKITTPKQAFGFNVGDDYQLVNYTQETEYLQKLAKESDRMKLVDIGLTAEGRHQYMAIISSPENMKNLEHYREISQKLALAKGLTDDQAKALADEGKAIVWIDGGLHASETVGAQQLVETIYELNAKTDPETMRFLHDDIVLCTFANPDGMELVSNWYMRNPDTTKRSTEGVPRLWQKYIGHDDNRDFFASNQPETTNVNRILSRVWYPQIVYNHHQAGPAGTVIFMPPFRDPNSYFYDPLVVLGIEAVGTAMHQRLVEEGKPGSTSRSGAPYSTWFNGSLRTVSYFHNEIGLLTEIIGNPTPEPLPLLATQQLPRNDLVAPVKPQLWHNAQSIAYEQTNNRAVLDYASRERTHLLYNFYLMGKDSVENGSADHWTITPRRIDALEAEAEKSGARVNRAGVLSPDASNAAGPRTQGIPADLYDKVLHDPKLKDARGYIVPADQPDFPTATKFINSLMKTGVEVQQASTDFEVSGKHYPAGSYVVFAAQAFRPQVLDMFEPQDHPNDFPYPGGPPNRPYDTTGWTLAFQMGVHFDRYTESFTGPFAPIKTDLAAPLPGKIEGVTGTPAGYLVSHEYNDTYTLTNRLLKANQPVYWLKDSVSAASDGNAKQLPPGALWLPYSAQTAQLLTAATKTLGINATAVSSAPTGAAIQLHPTRIALLDVYGGSMPSGWIRWLFDQFEFPFTNVYPQELDAGNLNAKYDVIVAADGIIRAPRPGGRGGGGFFGREMKPDEIPAEFRPWLGSITPAKTYPQLQSFVQNGGTLLAIGTSTSIASFLKLPLVNAPMEMVKGELQPVPPERFYIPGSLLKAHVDNTDPIAYGVAPNVIVDFDSSPAFTLDPQASLNGLHAVAWYDDDNLLASGWAWGQKYINHTTAVATAPVGKGQVVLYGPEVTFRGQPHATFKFLFNGILYGPSTPTVLK